MVKFGPELTARTTRQDLFISQTTKIGPRRDRKNRVASTGVVYDGPVIGVS